MIIGVQILWHFNRCQLWEKQVEIKEMKEQLNELVGLLRQSEARRKEVEKELKLREQAVAIALATSASVRQLYYVDFVYNPSFCWSKCISNVRLWRWEFARSNDEQG